MRKEAAREQELGAAAGGLALCTGARAPMTGAVSFAPLDRLHAARDRLLASASFRLWAARFPLTRRIVRRRARAAFDLCSGFVYSQVLLACVRLDLFRILAERPQSVEILARRLAVGVDATRRLLTAAIALRLVEARAGARYGLGPLGATIAGEPAILAMIEHNALLYADLADPVALLRGTNGHTRLAEYWPYAAGASPSGLPAERVAPYSDLMSASQPLVSAEILAAYRFDRHACVLDVGGGEGGFLCSAGARHAHLRLVLFDLPAVAQRAQARFARAGLSDRATVVGGNFLADPLPVGADLVCLVRVIHDHEDAQAATLLRNVRRALPKDGALVIAEPMSDTPGAEAVGDAYFGMYLLAMGRGKARTSEELSALVRAAGFVDVRRLPTAVPLQAGVMVARAG